MARYLSSLLVSTGLLVAGFTAPAHSVCTDSAEDVAVQVRALQTRLMVAALACRAQLNPEYPVYYNSFVRKFGSELAQHAHVLRAHFEREHGRSGDAQMDAFITRIANGVSQDSMSDGNFCRASKPLFQRVLGAQPGELGDFAAAIAPSPSARPSCAVVAGGGG